MLMIFPLPLALLCITTIYLSAHGCQITKLTFIAAHLPQCYSVSSNAAVNVQISLCDLCTLIHAFHPNVLMVCWETF